MKYPPAIFILDHDNAVLKSLDVLLTGHGYTVQCFTSAADFVAKQDPNQAGCIVVDFVRSTGGDALLHWLHESGSLLSVVNVAGLIGWARPSQQDSAPVPAVVEPFEAAALFTMVADGIAGSLSRQTVQDRSRLKG